MTSGSHRPAQFGVQCLDGVGRVNDPPYGLWERKKRNDMLPVSPPTLRDCRIFLTPGRSVKLIEYLFAGVNRRDSPQMYGSDVCRKKFFDPAVGVPASIYPAFDWKVLCSGRQGYRRACDLISGPASNGPFGSPVFARAWKTDPCRISCLRPPGRR
jgi:hypothetical protein